MNIANSVYQREVASRINPDGQNVNESREDLTVKTLTAGAITGSTAITSSNPTAGMGYATGAGGAVTQATSKVTGVTLSKVCGAITTAADALAAGAEASFIVTNTTVAATDVVIVCIKSGPATAGTYAVSVSAVGAGSFTVTITNFSAGSLSEAVVINFAVIEAVAA
jgi:hypothetical protein